MGKMFLMCGMSGAGKTTFAKQFAAENGCVYLGIDEFYSKYSKRIGLKNVYDNSNVAFRVWIEFFNEIHFYETEGKDVVVDTNAPTFVKRAQFIDWFPTFEEHNLIYIHADRNLRRRNNASRNRVVPDDVMEKMEKEFEYPITKCLWSDKFPFMVNTKHRESFGLWDNVRVFVNKDNVLTEVPTLQESNQAEAFE